MNRLGIVLLCSLFIVASRSLATDFNKLSGYVKSLLLQQQASPAMSRSTHPAKEQTITAFIRSTDSNTCDLFRQHRCKAFAKYGDLAIVSIPVSQVASLSESPAIRRIEASPTGFLTMDTTAIIVGANKIYESMPPLTTPTPLSGKDVVVGVMDVGFDLTHPNFYDASATHYRIGAFWDQLSKDTVGSEFPVGRDFVTTEEILSHEHSVDGLIQTHGTHTLGIAAGGGYQSPYRGIAYDAELCLVSNAISNDISLIDSADISKYTTAVDALGFKYMFDYADRQGKPCVVSFSEGYTPYLDREDSLYSAFLDSLTAVPGHIIVVSAGNESVNTTYLEKPAGKEEAGTFIGGNDKQSFYKIKTDGPFGLTLYAYRENNSVPTDTLKYLSTDDRLDSLLTDTLLWDGDTCAVRIERYAGAMMPETGYMVFLNTSYKQPLIPMALVVTSATSHIEVYGSSTYPLKTNAIDSRWQDAIQGHNILAPACFPSVICVGATAHRLGFVNYKGEYKDYSSGHMVGKLSSYSSTGPTMNGLLKPDVTAAGNNVISSYSSYYIEANPDANDINSDVEHFQFQDRTYAWNANSGTSMSAPVVAGVIALWLQAKPTLTREEVMQILSRSCRHPEPELTYPNYKYGYGEIDAYQGLLEILGIDGIKELNIAQSGTTNRRIKIYSLKGTLLVDRVLSSNSPSHLSLPQGLYIVQTYEDQQLMASELVKY